MLNTYVAVDLETTGMNPVTDHILEIGAVRIIDGEPRETYTVFIDSGIEIPVFITNLTGISTEMAKSGVKIKKGMEDFIDFCGSDAILGHNIMFDFSFLKKNARQLDRNFEKNGIDTLKIARKYLKQLPSKRLEALCTYYQIKQEKKHRACDDAMAASNLYQHMQKDFGQNCPDDFKPLPLYYKVKKESSITKSQKVYLIDLVKYHRIDLGASIDKMTKSEASRKIDHIILNYGRIRGDKK